MARKALLGNKVRRLRRDHELSQIELARRYLARDGRDISWDLIRAAWGSVAVFAITPMQDLLGLDNAARMNYPSTLGGNWIWRMPAGALDEFLRSRLYETNLVYGRLAEDDPEEEG